MTTFAAVSDIMIERTREEVTITLKTARPGLVIGPKGAEVFRVRYRGKPNPAYVEVLEDQLEAVSPGQ